MNYFLRITVYLKTSKATSNVRLKYLSARLQSPKQLSLGLFYFVDSQVAINLYQ